MAKKPSKKPSKKAPKKPVKKAAKKPAKKTAKAKAKKPVKKAVKKVAKKVVKKTVKKAAKKVIKKAPKKVAKVTSTKAVVKTGPKFKQHKTHLQVGERAPFFEGIDQNGNTVSSYLLGGRNIILYFYPKDHTEGCTAQACSLRDEHYFLGTSNYVVVGVSADDQESHLKFASKHSLPFPLIADTNMEIIKAFDVWGTKQLAGRIYDGIVRTTFIIGADGIIKHIITDVDTKEHAKQILAL
ncbi:MAG: thioredoxin-dependent thiol peroxidase [Bacteroidia bacterium]|nr:thioredoxin-dependent thiol peroxidase [Sphingobacteriaceae bacterium]MBK7309493.1 thioredoxin-dependent thiol peroxidase [Sphingobacteriaceae bacterium]MBK7818777.1 thioredoxin-dependent thiol peroxidase [Sphingobacteriaceae bacterium]MBP9068379.1 thioredoxin-dependent thiol peroxidase [Bacteroidia bacterium]